MRLDQLLVERGLFASREQARRAVMAGWVEVDGRRVDKPGTAIGAEAALRLAGTREPFASRAGRKLAGALDHFQALHPELAPEGTRPLVAGRVCLDIGASTGGFTDCLLQRGAARVYAVDVGYGQLDLRLRNDPRVVVMERVNARYLTPGDIPEPCALATVDVSFISLAKVVPALVSLLVPGGFLLVLVKPQFEAGRGMVGKGGILRREELRQKVVEETVAGLEAPDLVPGGLERWGVIDSDLAGVGGNREALALLRKPSSPGEAP